MARNRWICVTPAKQACPVALFSILGITAPANIREAITGITIAFDGNSNVAVPVLVEVYRATTAGTASANNPVQLDKDIATALQVTGFVNFTVEPTKGDRLNSWLVHPQSGMPLPLPLPDGEIIVPGGQRVVVAVTAPAIVNATCEIRGEE